MQTCALALALCAAGCGGADMSPCHPPSRSYAATSTDLDVETDAGSARDCYAFCRQQTPLEEIGLCNVTSAGDGFTVECSYVCAE